MAGDVWESISAIATDVLEQRFLPTSTLLPEHCKYEDALLFAYMACGTANPKWEKHCVERLNLAIGQDTREMSHCALFRGLCGLGWTVEHVSQILGGASESDEPQLMPQKIPGEDPNEEIDTAVTQRLHSGIQAGDFDLISGLVGYGVYFLERWPAGRSIEGLESVIVALESIAEDVDSGTTWCSPPETLPAWQRIESPAGYYNLGVAHGVPGVVQFLCQVVKTGIKTPRVSSLLDRAIAWLLAQAGSDRKRLRFSSWVNSNGESRDAQPVWCYGDLGIAAILLQVEKGCANRTIGTLAHDMLETCLELPVHLYHVQDAGLCHGATGVAHIYNRIYQMEGDPRFRDAALQWYESALDMFRPGTGVGGYSKCLMPDRQGTVVWEGWPAFLDGSIGIALALLGAVTHVEPRWDRALLLSSRFSRTGIKAT